MFAKFWHLPAQHKRLAVRILAALAWFRLTMVNDTCLERFPLTRGDYGAALDPATLGRLVEQVAGYTPWKSNCLVRARVCAHLLGGTDYHLHIGVRKTEGGIGAHAWLSVMGMVICGGASADDYEEIVSLDSRDGFQDRQTSLAARRMRWI